MVVLLYASNPFVNLAAHNMKGRIRDNYWCPIVCLRNVIETPWEARLHQINWCGMKFCLQFGQGNAQSISNFFAWERNVFYAVNDVKFQFFCILTSDLRRICAFLLPPSLFDPDCNATTSAENLQTSQHVRGKYPLFVL